MDLKIHFCHRLMSDTAEKGGILIRACMLNEQIDRLIKKLYSGKSLIT